MCVSSVHILRREGVMYRSLIVKIFDIGNYVLFIILWGNFLDILCSLELVTELCNITLVEQ